VVSLVPSNGEPGLPSSCAAADSVVFRVASLRDRGGTQEAFFGDASSRTARPRGPLEACGAGVGCGRARGGVGEGGVVDEFVFFPDFRPPSAWSRRV
jgi:hypothetical protein